MIFSKLKSQYDNSDFRRRILVQAGLRMGAVLLLALLWHLFLASPGRQADLVLILGGVLLFAWAWGQYLRMDGLFQHGLVKRKDKPTPVGGGGTMADRLDTDPRETDAASDKEERRAASFFANLISGGICLLGGLVMGYIL